MLFVDFAIHQLLPSKLNYNQIPNNTYKAITAALIAFVIFFVVTLGVTAFFQSTAFIQGSIDASSLNSMIQSVMRHGFSATGLSAESPIFAGSKFLTYFQYGIVIAMLETRYLVRAFDYLTQVFSISLGSFSARMGMVYVILGGAFVWFHANVKGVEDNVALLMTFIFAIATFELARRFREMEAATDLHMINNLVFIANKIGF